MSSEQLNIKESSYSLLDSQCSDLILWSSLCLFDLHPWVDFVSCVQTKADEQQRSSFYFSLKSGFWKKLTSKKKDRTKYSPPAPPPPPYRRYGFFFFWLTKFFFQKCNQVYALWNVSLHLSSTPTSLVARKTGNKYRSLWLCSLRCSIVNNKWLIKHVTRMVWTKGRMTLTSSIPIPTLLWIHLKVFLLICYYQPKIVCGELFQILFNFF